MTQKINCERIPNYQASGLEYPLSTRNQTSKNIDFQKPLKRDSENLARSTLQSSSSRPRGHELSARPLQLALKEIAPNRLGANLTPSNERFVSKAKPHQSTIMPGGTILTDRTNIPTPKEEGHSSKMAPSISSMGAKKIFKSTRPQEESQFKIPKSSEEVKKPYNQDLSESLNARKPSICDKKPLKINTANPRQKNISPLNYEKTIPQDRKLVEVSTKDQPRPAASVYKLPLPKESKLNLVERPQTPPKDDEKDSPCHYEDSPPVKINPVRALESKRKPHNHENEAHQKRMSEYVSQTSLNSVENKENLFGENYKRHHGTQIFPSATSSMGQIQLVQSGVYSGGVGTANRKLDGIVEPKSVNHYQNNKVFPYAFTQSQEIKALPFKLPKSLTDIKIFKEVIKFLTVPTLCQMTKVCKKFRSDEYNSLLKKAQCRLIMKGLSQQDQYAFWDFHLNFGFLHKTYPLQYSMNASKVCNFERDILSDLDRTRSFNQVIPQRQNSLLKVLIALSNAIPKVGYVQGLNSIAAVFLAHNITDSEAYWILKYIFKKKHFDDAMLDNFAKVQLLTYQLEIYMRNYLPEIIDHLGENGINVSYFATQWFITMFSYDFELSHLTKVWNLFFIKGWKMIIRIALSLLWHFQDEICSKSCDDLPSFLKSFVSERISEICEEDLFKVGFSFKVSNRLLKSLETLYDHSAPINTILVSNQDKKLEWKILPEDCSILNASTASQKDIMEYLNEDLDRMRTLNRIRGDIHHELDSYRSVNSNSINGSIVLGDLSMDMKSSITSFHGNQSMSMRKSTDSSFIQTISNFGRKLRQILTPKENNNDTSFSRCKIKNAKVLDFQNHKDLMEYSAPYTDRSANQSHCMSSHKSHKLIVSTDIKGTTPFKKSIINGLRESHDKLGINMFDPLNSKERDHNRLFMQGSKTTSASTNDLFDQIDAESPYLDSQLSNFKSSFSSNQEILKELKRSQILCLDQVLDERYEEERLSVGRFKETTPKYFDRMPEEMSRSFHVPNNRRASLNGSFTTATEHLRNGERLRVKTSDRSNPLNIDQATELGRTKRYDNHSRMTIPEVANY